MKKVKIALTGRLRVGKDHIASRCGGRIIGFADPLYQIVEFLTNYGPDYKDTVPAVRKLYQTFGQWGRGEVNEQYPLGVERSIFSLLAKSGLLSAAAPDVDFSQWGTPDIWLNTLIARAAALPDSRLFCTNVRFKNELDRLTSDGWDHWHVLCSRQTYEERLRGVDMTINDPRLRDISEQLAGLLDNSVVQIIKTQPTGDKLKVIWNDQRTSPSDRLFTLEEFKQYVENNECEPEYSYPESADEPGTETVAAPNNGIGASHVSECDSDPAVAPSESRNPAERRRKRRAAKTAR